MRAAGDPPADPDVVTDGPATAGPRWQLAVSALRVPNFRLYYSGQLVSLTGTWMQAVAQSWLVLQLTGSGTMLGLVAAAQFGPVLLLGPYGGLVADRADKRRLLLLTQSMLGLLALTLGLLTVSHVVQIWMIFVVAVAFGTVAAVDNPARQSFIPELVGRQQLAGAVSLNSVAVNAARTLGPAAAGILIAAVGAGVCFLLNAASFVAVLVALAYLRTDRLQPARPVPRAPGQLRQGLRYVRRTTGLLVPLLMMALIGTLTYEFPVVLPLLARDTLRGGATTYGWLTAAMGAGAIAGGLLVAAYQRTGVAPLTAIAAAFGVAVAGAAAASSIAVEVVVLALAGAAGTAFLATGNSSLQLESDPRFRGRVMALWSVTFLGSTPVGGPIVGVVSERWGPRTGLALGAAACFAAAAIGLAGLTRLPAGERRGQAPDRR